ncbi:MAG: DUF1232 domain-containing protein [Thermomicrobiales bacterium]
MTGDPSPHATPDSTPASEPVTPQEVSPTIVPDTPAATPAKIGPEPALRESADQPVLGAFWDVVKRIPAYARLIAAMSRDPDVPAQAKASLAVGGAYLLSPVDLIPGIIPVAGQIDDLYVVLSALRIAMRTSPPEAVSRHLAAQHLHPSQVDQDLAVIRRLVREGIRKAISLSSKAAVDATHRATRLTQKARTALANRGTRTP